MKRATIKTLLPVILAIANITGNIQNLYAFFPPYFAGNKQVTQTADISGELKKWHKITFTFTGPQTNETATPNPFLDYRLDVTFTHSSGKVYKVPGYYAADGNAAESGAISGDKWRAHFSPDLIGSWAYKVSMRQGTAIAVSDVGFEGSAVSGVDGLSGSITIAASDKTGVDFRAKGRLNYTGASCLQFAETGEYFRKTGADAPENFLAYNDFDNTSNYNNYRKSWSSHMIDWASGNPTWKSGLGKGIIGAVNYLSSVGMNTFSFLTMNIRGDDRNVWPYIDTAMRTRMDVSKLDQWEIVFDHAQTKGMHLHFKTQEAENCKLLDGGAVGTERKLYYRELIARFGHHLALSWNLGEENTQTNQQQKDMAQYFWDHDPYKHNIDLHTFPNQQETYYRPLIGTASSLTGVSIQTDISNVYTESRKWVEASALAGKKWIVANDEQGSAAVGVATDAEYTGKRGSVADNSEQVRRAVLWGNLMAGGAGVEYYFGYNTGETDLTCQDFRSRAKSWRYAKIAQDFFHNYLPTTTLKPLSNTSSGWSIGNDSTINVIYLSAGGTASVTLKQNNYSVKWYNPRSGGSLQNGTITNVGTGTVSIGYPPSDVSLDWIALITKTTATAVSNATNGTLSATSYRVNSGGPAVTNSIGTFAADAYYSSGNTYSTLSTIAGTTNGTMYQTERYGTNGTLNYAFPISNGSYKVVLHFAELYWTAASKRIFDVNIEGSKVLDNYDIFRKVGALTAISETFAVNINDGTLNINFSSLAADGGVDQPKVSAIEVIPAAPASYKINAGGLAVTNSIGTFAADAYYSSGNTYSTTNTIYSTNNPTMYQTERYGTNGTLSYAFPISSGNYNVVLHFAELYWTAAGKRLFDVNIEGAKVLDNYDIYRKVGAFTATTENFPVTVSDGTLNINFSSLAADGGFDQPKISAIEIVAAGTSTTTAVSAPSTVTNSGNIVTIKATYASAPVNPSASFADLGNNKRIGFILTKDDGGSGDYAAVYPIINGGISPLNGVSYPGFTYSDGAGGTRKWGYTFAINGRGNALKDGSNSSVTTWNQYKEILANSNFALANHSADHTNSPSALYELQLNDTIIRNQLGFNMRTVVIPAGLPGFVAAGIQMGFINAWSSEGYGGPDNPSADGYASEISWNDAFDLTTLTNNPNWHLLGSRHNFDTEYADTLTAFKSWVNAKFSQAASANHKMIFTAFSHGPGTAAEAGYLNQMLTFIKNHPQNKGDVWFANLQQFSEYLETKKLAVKSAPSISNNVVTYTIDLSALPAKSRYKDMSLILTTGGTLQNVEVTGADSYTFNTSTGLVNIYKGGQVSGAITSGAAARVAATDLQMPSLKQSEENTSGVYPNPNRTGRFTVALPKKAEGEIAYQLISASGAKLAGGKLTAINAQRTIQFDFKSQMQSVGIYYLQLEGKDLRKTFKLNYVRS